MNANLSRSVGIVVAIAAALLVAGAAMPVAAEDTQSFHDEVTISDDGEIASLESEMVLPEEEYNEWLAIASEEGYDTVGEWQVETAIENDPAIHDGTGYDEEQNGQYSVVTEYTEVDVDQMPDMSVTTDGDSVTWEFDQPEQTADGADIEQTLAVVMPDSISDTNADEVDGTVANWDMPTESSQLFVESGGDESDAEDETDDDAVDDADDADDTVVEDDDTDDADDAVDEDDGADDADDAIDEDDDADDADEMQTDEADDTTDDATDDSMPGLGVGAAIVGLLVATLLVARQSN